MIPEKIPQPPAAILPQQVWETLDWIHQQACLQVVIRLCQQILAAREEESSHEPTAET